MYSQMSDALSGQLLTSIRRDRDGAIIPADPANADYDAFETWRSAGNTPAPAAAAAPCVPPTVSDRQFFQQLTVAGKITQDEALAYVGTGALPASMNALLTQLPADAQFAARMTIIGAHAFLRGDPLTTQLGTLYGLSPADLDAFWTAAAKL